MNHRPRSIVLFEWLIYGPIAIEWIGTGLHPRIVEIIGDLGTVVLVWAIAHRGMRWVAWVFTVWVLAVIPFNLAKILHLYALHYAITLQAATLQVIMDAMQLFAVVLLFTKGTRLWFNREKALGHSMKSVPPFRPQ